MKYPQTITSDREGLKRLIIEKLKENPHDFLERKKTISREEKEGTNYNTSGVLLPLRFSEDVKECEIVLTKRSKTVVQPGDLSFPGGHVDKKDRLHGFFIAHGLTPGIMGEGLRGQKTDPVALRLQADYLATALREAREETGLATRNVEYLGSLPSYGLSSFKRVIFPSVGLVKGKWVKRLNWEVESLIPVALTDMLLPERYFWLDLDLPDDLRAMSLKMDWKFPAFVIGDGNDKEVLWGATLNIILSFLWIVLGFTLPDIPDNKTIRKEIPKNYFTGSFKEELKEGLKGGLKGES